jgi:Spy/CpxP family protein refolding chaperone
MCGLVAVLAVLASGLPWAMAQDDGGGKKAKKAQDNKADRAGKTVGSFDYAGVASELGLTKEQTDKLAGLIINQQALLRMQRLGLTDEQRAKVKALCMDTGKEVLTMDARGQGQGMRTLDEKIRTQVLTDEQRAKLNPKRAATTQKAGGGN